MAKFSCVSIVNAAAALCALLSIASCGQGNTGAATSAPLQGTDPRMVVLAHSSGSVALGQGPVRATLAADGGTNVAAHIAGLAPDRRVFLVFRGLSAAAEPGAGYAIYLGLPKGVMPAAGDRHYVDSINFFNAVRPAGTAPGDQFFSFDVTSAVHALAGKGELGQGLDVVFVPEGPIAASAKPVVGRVELVEM